MRIFASRAFGFREPKTGKLLSTKPGQFQDVPDWAKGDALFGAALKEGLIEIVQTPETPETPERAKREKKEKEG